MGGRGGAGRCPGRGMVGAGAARWPAGQVMHWRNVPIGHSQVEPRVMLSVRPTLYKASSLFSAVQCTALHCRLAAQCLYPVTAAGRALLAMHAQLHSCTAPPHEVLKRHARPTRGGRTISPAPRTPLRPKSWHPAPCTLHPTPRSALGPGTGPPSDVTPLLSIKSVWP